MSHLYLHFNKADLNKPWSILETNEDRTVMLKTNSATELEVNVPCKTFVGKFHYFACEGVVTWDGTKAIINPA